MGGEVVLILPATIYPLCRSGVTVLLCGHGSALVRIISNIIACIGLVYCAGKVKNIVSKVTGSFITFFTIRLPAASYSYILGNICCAYSMRAHTVTNSKTMIYLCIILLKINFLQGYERK